MALFRDAVRERPERLGIQRVRVHDDVRFVLRNRDAIERAMRNVWLPSSNPASIQGSSRATRLKEIAEAVARCVGFS